MLGDQVDAHPLMIGLRRDGNGSVGHGSMGHHFWMGHVGRGSLPVTH